MGAPSREDVGGRDAEIKVNDVELVGFNVVNDVFRFDVGVDEADGVNVFDGGEEHSKDQTGVVNDFCPLVVELFWMFFLHVHAKFVKGLADAFALHKLHDNLGIRAIFHANRFGEVDVVGELEEVVLIGKVFHVVVFLHNVLDRVALLCVVDNGHQGPATGFACMAVNGAKDSEVVAEGIAAHWDPLAEGRGIEHFDWWRIGETGLVIPDQIEFGRKVFNSTVLVVNEVSSVMTDAFAKSLQLLQESWVGIAVAWETKNVAFDFTPGRSRVSLWHSKLHFPVFNWNGI